MPDDRPRDKTIERQATPEYEAECRALPASRQRAVIDAEAEILSEPDHSFGRTVRADRTIADMNGDDLIIIYRKLDSTIVEFLTVTDLRA